MQRIKRIMLVTDETMNNVWLVGRDVSITGFTTFKTDAGKTVHINTDQILVMVEDENRGKE